MIDDPRFHTEEHKLVFPRALLPAARSQGKFSAHLEFVAGWFTTALADSVRRGDTHVAVEDTTCLVPGRDYELPSDPDGWNGHLTISPAWSPPTPRDLRYPGGYRSRFPCIGRTMRAHTSRTCRHRFAKA